MSFGISVSCGKKKKKSTGCRNDRIRSETLIHCDTLVVRQDFCVSSLVGWSEEDPTTQQVNTTIFATPSDPVRPPLLLSVIARNVSDNSVDVRIFGADSENALVHDTVGANSEIALAAPNAISIQASASAPSRVLFFFTVFTPTEPI